MVNFGQIFTAPVGNGFSGKSTLYYYLGTIIGFPSKVMSRIEKEINEGKRTTGRELLMKPEHRMGFDFSGILPTAYGNIRDLNGLIKDEYKIFISKEGGEPVPIIFLAKDTAGQELDSKKSFPYDNYYNNEVLKGNGVFNAVFDGIAKDPLAGMDDWVSRITGSETVIVGTITKAEMTNSKINLINILKGDYAKENVFIEILQFAIDNGLYALAAGDSKTGNMCLPYINGGVIKKPLLTNVFGAPAAGSLQYIELTKEWDETKDKESSKKNWELVGNAKSEYKRLHNLPTLSLSEMEALGLEA